MEFPSLGQRCNMASCQQLDLLPICCSYCDQQFCKLHFQPFDHSCPSHKLEEKNLLETSKLTTTENYTCSLAGCSTKELVLMLCSYCSLHFCLQHRHQVDHHCEKLEERKEQMVQTAALVKQIQEKNSGKKITQGVKSDKLAAKVQLMKLKQHSKGVNELPVEERVYFSVQKPLDEEKVAVFVSKFWSVGKCIDYISSTFKISNFNNVAGKPHLNLFTSAGYCFSDKKDTIVKELLESETLFNGQTIVMKYIDQ